MAAQGGGDAEEEGAVDEAEDAEMAAKEEGGEHGELHVDAGLVGAAVFSWQPQ